MDAPAPAPSLASCCTRCTCGHCNSSRALAHILLFSLRCKQFVNGQLSPPFPSVFQWRKDFAEELQKVQEQMKAQQEQAGKLKK